MFTLIEQPAGTRKDFDDINEDWTKSPLQLYLLIEPKNEWKLMIT